MSITVSGTPPATIFENGLPADWLGRFHLPAGLLEVALHGPSAGLFTVAYSAISGVTRVSPFGILDAEALGAGTVLSFGLSVRTAAGWQVLPVLYNTTLIGLNDTPPQALRFVTGGIVLATDRGAAIGLLTVDDPDSTGPFEYEVAWPSSAFFVMEGATLRLREGVDLLTLAGTTIEVMIEVSDGLNMSAHTVQVAVLVPGPLPRATIQDGTFFNDLLSGGVGADAIHGHAGADSLIGLDGDDLLEGGSGNDTLRGGNGNDTLLGGSEADILAGDGGNDLLDGGAGNDRLNGGGHNDTLDGGAGADTLSGDNGLDLLRGGDGDDLLTGGEAADTLEGGEGADTLDGGTGTNRLVGGPGNDVYLLSVPDEAWVELPDGGVDEVVVGWSAVIPEGMERLRLRDGAGDLSATGRGSDDGLFGNAARNLLSGLAGQDWLDGGAGEDTLDGGEGADTLLGGLGADILIGGNGHDRAEGGADADTLDGDAGDDTLLGGDAEDVLRGSEGADLLFGDSGNDRLEGGDGADLLAGGSGNDLIFGGDAEDRGFGAEGDDTIDGGVGPDTLMGEAGADLLLGGLGMDILDGGDGADTLDGGAGIDQLNGGAGNDLLRAGLVGEVASGLDLLRGGAGADTLDAAAGDGLGSLLFGGDGNDTYLIDSRLDQVIETGDAGFDTVRVSLASGGYALPPWVEALVLLGGMVFGLGNALNNHLLGNAGNNVLFGGAGADTLEGGAGQDTLIGGPGADVFVLGGDGSIDVLIDYNPAEDRLLMLSAAGPAWVRDASLAPVLLMPGGMADILPSDAASLL